MNYTLANYRFTEAVQNAIFSQLLAPGENRHFEPGENSQFQPGRNPVKDICFESNQKNKNTGQSLYLSKIVHVLQLKTLHL